jgi:aconitate hydratase 2/2-methylisocitrate dehydratase
LDDWFPLTINHHEPLTINHWISPAISQEQLTKEGYYSVYGKAGARTEMPGCSLCMGNQAPAAPALG